MNAKEFLASKGIKSTAAIVEPPTGEHPKNIYYEQPLEKLLDEYHLQASGQKIDLDKKFENKIEKDYTGPKLPPIK